MTMTGISFPILSLGSISGLRSGSCFTEEPVLMRYQNNAKTYAMLNFGFSLLKFSDYFQISSYFQINFIRGLYVT